MVHIPLHNYTTLYMQQNSAVTTGSNAVVIAYSETALENLIRIEVMSFVSYYTTAFLLTRDLLETRPFR